MAWVALLPKIVFAAVMLAWVVFAAVFIFGKRPAASVTPDRKREPLSLLGIGLQGLAYGLAWTIRRPLFTSFYAGPPWVDVIWAVFTIVIAFASVGIAVAAVRTLGKEWSLTARVVEGHRLVQTGPYRLVRHPIYTGMLGMLLATGFAIGNPYTFGISWLLFGIGTIIRIKYEERLLRETFGTEFDEYVRRVPAILPTVRWRKPARMRQKNNLHR
jgi:protein-S-isoprenylcysteine O-methyltransferase Ste14